MKDKIRYDSADGYLTFDDKIASTGNFERGLGKSTPRLQIRGVYLHWRKRYRL